MANSIMSGTHTTEADEMKYYLELSAASDADAKINERFKIFPLSAERMGLPLAELQEWMEDNDNRLAPSTVEVPPHWRKHSMPDRRYPGECFLRAIQFIQMFGPRNALAHNAVYVYGEALCGGPGQHGWVEIEDRIIFDGVQQQFYTKSGFYISEHAKPLYRFTRPAVIALWRRKQFRDNFRWDCHLNLPWATDPDHPLTVTLEMAKDILAKQADERR